MKPIFIALIVTLIMAGLSPVHADTVLDWNNCALEAIRKDRTPPPVASRALAISQAAIYDSVNSIYPTYTPYKFKLDGYAGASAEAAVAQAGFTALSALFPSQNFSAQLARSLNGIPEGTAKSLGIQLGNQVANNMLTWRQNDGWNAVYQYTPTTPPIPGRWQPTSPGGTFLLPQWGDVAPFTMESGDQFRQHNPPPLTSAAYAKDFNEVKSLGAANSNARTPDQTEIAKFWSDGAGTVTPPGHWNTIAQTVAQTKHTDLTENARLFALLDLSLADAGIAAWDMKRAFDFWRPITAIRNADKDGNAATAAAPTWESLLTTPSFPSCVSGHSTFSGAATAVLTEFFGTDDIAFSSTSDGLPNVARYYDSFSEAALEAGISRIYGGIHFELDDGSGLYSGDKIGRYVFANYLSPVPLPGTLAMILTGLIGMIGWRRFSYFHKRIIRTKINT